MAILTKKTLDQWKQHQFEKQHGKCLLCGLPLDSWQKANADHQHFGNGRMRGLLHAGCNVFEGRIQTLFYRAGLKNADWGLFLRNLSDYWNADYEQNPTHPNYVNDEAKRFSKYTRERMIKELNDACDLELDKTFTKEQLIGIYKSEFKKRL